MVLAGACDDDDNGDIFANTFKNWFRSLCLAHHISVL